MTYYCYCTINFYTSSVTNSSSGSRKIWFTVLELYSITWDDMITAIGRFDSDGGVLGFGAKWPVIMFPVVGGLHLSS